MMISKKFIEYILFMLMLVQAIVCCSITFEILDTEDDTDPVTTSINFIGSSGPDAPDIIANNPFFTNLETSIEHGNYNCKKSDTRVDMSLSGVYNDPVVILSDFTCDTCNAKRWGCYKPA